jgi:hypothetical protein
MDEVEFNYIREAVQEKHDRLMEKLVLHETNPLKEVEEPVTSKPPKEPFVYKRKAKYGLKKDGTPKAKPGRKA